MAPPDGGAARVPEARSAGVPDLPAPLSGRGIPGPTSTTAARRGIEPRKGPDHVPATIAGHRIPQPTTTTGPGRGSEPERDRPSPPVPAAPPTRLQAIVGAFQRGHREATGAAALIRWPKVGKLVKDTMHERAWPTELVVSLVEDFFAAWKEARADGGDPWLADMDSPPIEAFLSRLPSLVACRAGKRYEPPYPGMA